MEAAVIQRDRGPEVFSFDDVPGPVCAGDAVVIVVETSSIDGGDPLARLMTPPSGPSQVLVCIAAGTVRAIGTNADGGTLAERVVAGAANGSHPTQRAASAARVGAISEGLSTQELRRTRPRGRGAEADGQARCRWGGRRRRRQAAGRQCEGAGLARSARERGHRRARWLGGAALYAFSLWGRNNTRHGVRFATGLRAEYPRANARVAECQTRVASGELKAEVAKMFALAEAVQAHAFVEVRHAFGRAVMTA